MCKLNKLSTAKTCFKANFVSRLIHLIVSRNPTRMKWIFVVFDKQCKIKIDLPYFFLYFHLLIQFVYISQKLFFS